MLEKIDLSKKITIDEYKKSEKVLKSKLGELQRKAWDSKNTCYPCFRRLACIRVWPRI